MLSKDPFMLSSTVFVVSKMVVYVERNVEMNIDVSNLFCLFLFAQLDLMKTNVGFMLYVV